MSDSHGFTIVEVLIAVVLLTIGLLGSLSTAVAVSRQINNNHSYSTATSMASRLLERVRSENCRGAERGLLIEGDLNAMWRLEGVGVGLIRATVVVTSSTGVRARADTFSAMIPC